MSDYRPMPAERPLPEGVGLLGCPPMPEPAYRAGPEPCRPPRAEPGWALRLGPGSLPRLGPGWAPGPGPGHPPGPGHSRGAGHPPWPGRPAGPEPGWALRPPPGPAGGPRPGALLTRGGTPLSPGDTPGPHGPEPPAGPRPRFSVTGPWAVPTRVGILPDPLAARWAALAYLTVPVLGFLIPLALYLGAVWGPRGSGWTRCHAAQALNVWLTGLLYDLSAVIMGAMLALDSPWTALAVFAPLAVARWLVTIAFLHRAARAARWGRAYAFPRWLCTPIAR